MSTPKTVMLSDVERCPKTILRPQHYEVWSDGAVTCRCQSEPIVRLSFEEALSRLVFDLGWVTGTASRLVDAGGDIRPSIEKQMVHLDEMLKDPGRSPEDREVLIVVQAANEWIHNELNRLALAGPTGG